jgi:hypothetical protein
MPSAGLYTLRMRWNWPVKLKLLALVGAAVAMFAGLGYWLVPRQDPLWPFLLIGVPQPGWLLAVLLLGGMLLVLAAVGGLLLERELPHVGWLLVGAGWFGLSLRSEAINKLLSFLPRTDGQAQPPLAPTFDIQALYARLAIELALLFGITAVACMLARWIRRMVYSDQELPTPPADAPEQAPPTPRVQQNPDITPVNNLSKSTSDLVCSFVGTGVLALVVYHIFISDSSDRGQVLFALSAGYFIAALGAHQVFPSASPWGVMASVPVSGGVCYLVTVLAGGERDFRFEAPMAIGLPLPIDWLGAALMAAAAGYLFSVRMLGLRAEMLRRRQAAASQ